MKRDMDLVRAILIDRYNIVSERDLRTAMQRTQEYLTSAEQQEQQRVVSMKAIAASAGR